VGLGIDDPVWVPTVFTKNRDRLLEGDIARAFFDRVVALAKSQQLLSDEHFTVDGTLIEAWAGHKSFQRKDSGKKSPPPDDPGNPTVNYRGEKRSNATHESKTDPEAWLARKSQGQESKLAYMGQALMENRNGLVVNTRVTRATGRAEREAAAEMIGEIAVRTAALWPPTRATTRGTSFSRPASRESPHISPKTPATAGAQSTGARLATLAMRSANELGSESKRSSAG
jgi:hypothetical protein